MSRTEDMPLPPYARSLAGSLLAAREAVMAPIRPWLREVNVTEQQWRVLRVLADGGPLDAKTIAAKALLYPPTVTRILRELTERDLIGREADAEDRRRSVITITAQGSSLVAGTARHTSILLRSYEDAFGKDRLERFVAEAQDLAAALAQFRPME